MKKFVSLLLALVMVLSLAACGKKDAAVDNGEQGKVFNIYTFNEEFKGFFEKYYTVPEGITVNWTIVPNDGGGYQKALDEVLLNNTSAAADERVDMFLAEADYILKYVNSDVTTDVTKFGVTDFSNAYQYTVQVATDANGATKGVSFQCCPSAMIYRRSIAKDVLGTDDPAQVQELVNSWDKFNAVAAQAKDKGYYMTASDAETYRVFSNNTSAPWVDANNNLQISPEIEAWIEQADMFSQNGYTINTGIWDQEKNDQMFVTGKTLAFFGPAWYFNFCMGNAHNSDENPNGCTGDWAICEGPQAHFWGGTWLLAATGTDNADMVADIMNTFINNEDVCTKLVKDEAQFSNNQKVNNTAASDDTFASEFLGGQNPNAIFAELAKNIKFENQTIYDQIINEQIQSNMREYFKGDVDKATALQNFYKAVKEAYPAVNVPEA